jgi:hypothetical protein
MSKAFKEMSRVSFSRHLQKAAAQPDGRVLLLFGKLNIAAGCLLALWLMVTSTNSNIGSAHVALLLGLPLVGFVWFLRDVPSPHLIEFEHIIRKPWQRKICVLLQLAVGLAPWVAITKAVLR